MFLIVNKHKRIKALLSAYIDEELKERDKNLVERHLAACDSCLHELESLRATVDLLKRIPVVSPGRSFLVQAEKKARPRPAPPVWQPVPVPIIITVLLTLALFLGDFFQALPYSEKSITKTGVSAPAPMRATEARPQMAAISAPSPAPAPESPRILQPAAREAQAEKALPEGKESPQVIPEAAKAVSSGEAAAVAAPVGTPSPPAPPTPARPAAPSGPAGQAIKPGAPSYQIKAAPSVNAPIPATGEPQGAEAPAPDSRPVPQPTLAPAPVPQTLLPEALVNEPSVKASPPARREEITRDKVPVNDPGRNFFVIPWRLVEILSLIITVLLIVHTILKKKKSPKEINSF